MDTNKRKPADSFPDNECQYGEGCYRKNPVHFSEFSHPHLEDMLVKGRNSTDNEYEIPRKFYADRFSIQEQLKILEQVFPNLVGESSKISKIDPLVEKKQEEPKTVESKPESKPGPSSNLTQKCDDISNLFAERRKKMQEQKKEVVQEKVVEKKEDTSQLSLRKILNKDVHEYFRVVPETGRMAEKLKKAAPYNFFLTTVSDAPVTHKEPLSVSFMELLDPSLGELESSVQINFMVDLGWVLAQYFFTGNETKPLLILYGDETPELATISSKKPNVTAIKINMATPFGVHHTKMSLLAYKDGSMRVVVSTANLYEPDWDNRVQGLWISPKLPALPDDSDTAAGESPTEFREGLMMYLVAYNIPKLAPWIARIRKSDFSSINVFFVASVPGGHRTTPKGFLWGHPKLGQLLGKHSAQIEDASPIVAQSSSIGSLGPSPQAWILSEIANSFRKDSAPLGLRRIPGFRMIYPSVGNVMNSHDGMLGGGCLPYGKAGHDKQLWLKDYLHQWKCKSRNRNQAMPHIKSYARWSDKGLYWFHVTSANLSKSAWGAFNKSAKLEQTLRINSYEAGVLFVPKFVLGPDEKVFPMNDTPSSRHPKFPMPYDIPLTPYSPEDTPFFMDYLR